MLKKITKDTIINNTEKKIINNNEKLEQITNNIKKLKLYETKLNKINLNIYAIKIQKIYRSYIYRLNHLPLILYIYFKIISKIIL